MSHGYFSAMDQNNKNSASEKQPHFRSGQVPALLGIICGGIAFVYFPIYFGPLGIILGIVAIRKGSRQLGWNAVGISVGGTCVGFVLSFLLLSQGS